MASLLGWKSILRPIRDGYRRLFPSPDTGLSPEERERQRRLDRLKGFTYFDTFDQLDTWTETDANYGWGTPVLLCHDYSGNYHDYEAAGGIGVEAEHYSCEYLQFVHVFVYFSHKLVCVPPPSWTNTLHRNGVKAFGTLIIEPQTKDLERLLGHSRSSNDGTLTFPMATKLAHIAKRYCFDGWLVNIEKPFARDSWDPHMMERFLEQLGDQMGPGSLIWYDALTAENKVDYQNALTGKNALFSKAAGAVLTNYSWKEQDATKSKDFAARIGLPPQSVFAGVDVWAQNKRKLTHRREAYGGGGTNTGIAVNTLRGIGLSVGIFAPAWSFQHFPGHGRAAERAMWDGHTLSDKIVCSCGKANEYHPPNRGYPITRSARRYAAGSAEFFFTDFSRAFGKHGKDEADRRYNLKSFHSQLASQSILPQLARTSVKDDAVDSGLNILSMKIDDMEDISQLVVQAYSVIPQGDAVNELYERWLPLFDLDMSADGSLELQILCQSILQKADTHVSFYLRFTTGITFLDPMKSESGWSVGGSIHAGIGLEATERLREIGVHLRAPRIDETPLTLAKIRCIRIVPTDSVQAESHCSLDGIGIEKRGEGEEEHWRLSWEYHEENGITPPPSGMPYSDSTGPFSYFWILVDGLKVGRVYAVECVLPNALVEHSLGQGQGIEVAITGYGFDGRVLASAKRRLSI